MGNLHRTACVSPSHWPRLLVSRIACVAALVAWLGCALPTVAAQNETQPPPSESEPTQPDVVQDPLDPDEGKIVRLIRFDPEVSYASSLTQMLNTKERQPLRRSTISEDIRNLWKLRQIRADVSLVDDGDGVIVIFEIDEQRAFDRLRFRGLENMSERDVLSLLQLTPGQRVNAVAAEKYAFTIRDRYQREGYAFATVRIKQDRLRSEITLFVDEGPKVTVSAVHFRGNHSFPTSAMFGLSQNLIGSAGMRSAPGIIIDGKYSEDQLAEDLDRLRYFYRKQGYRDARVELASVEFSRHRDKVAISIRVDEGPRYKVASVDVQRVLPNREIDPDPLYDKEEILEQLQLEPGSYYDHDRVELDQVRIREFYGARGHPSNTGGVGGFTLLEAVEVFDVEAAEIRVIHRVIEGEPKRLRDVIIRGNTETKDFVVRRKVFVLPGEVLDMNEVRRSIRVLNSLRYFQDLDQPVEVSYDLMPVPEEPEMLDLAIDLQEGDTGQFLWGAGVSTAAGVQARFVFSKRNFDIARPPSSWNPIDAVGEIVDGKAFHGAGQNLELLLAPGTEISQFQLSFFEPDIFSRHFDVYGLRVAGFRTLRFFDSFDMDSLGANVALNRQFTENFDIGLQVRQENVKVKNIDANAPTIVYDSEGSTELRGLKLSTTLREFDDFYQPTDGYQLRAYGELIGGVFGGDADFFKAGLNAQRYTPIYRDARDRAHVFFARASFDYGEAYGDSDELFLTERFYMGGRGLRGFDQRRAGPSQFGKPVGGEARYLTTLEYQFPLVSTRRERGLRETEMLRGVLFTDFGLLGRSLSDPEFSHPRLSVGFGLRIFVPVFEVPIALDLGWPVLDQDTDAQRQFFFSLSRF